MLLYFVTIYTIWLSKAGISLMYCTVYLSVFCYHHHGTRIMLSCKYLLLSHICRSIYLLSIISNQNPFGGKSFLKNTRNFQALFGSPRAWILHPEYTLIRGKRDRLQSCYNLAHRFSSRLYTRGKIDEEQRHSVR